MEDYQDFESAVDYNTVLDDFEGPLDLLLHMINCAKIRIEDVFVSQVTEQFLSYIDYMKSQPSRDVDKESEYLAIATQIIYIKSKSILPVVEINGEEFGGAEVEQQEFIEQLRQREYELIKNETPKLKELETFGYYFRDPDDEVNKIKIVYKDFNVQAMLEAFANLMLKNESRQREKENFREIPKDIYTVEEQAQHIKQILISQRKVQFSQLFKTYSRVEIITTFQALLEMLKHQQIKVNQTDSFGEIDIELNSEWNYEEDNDEQFDEYD